MDEERHQDIDLLRDTWAVPPPSADLPGRVMRAFECEFVAAEPPWLVKPRSRLYVAASLALCLTVAFALRSWMHMHYESKPSTANVGLNEKSGSNTPSTEVLTEFVSLMDAQPPVGRGILVRAIVPVAMMRSAGLRGWESAKGDTVQADVLLGEEGLPRAIRFVVAVR
jgi:hypothetical protein